MRTVWKFQLEMTGVQKVAMPAGAEILSAAIQPPTRTLCLWALVDDDEAELETRSVYIVGTGTPMPAGVGSADFIGTVLDPPYVWHLFDGGAR